MKSVIYYFSATGNSLVVARDLSEGLGGAEVLPMTRALKYGQDDSYDIIGIVFPVYMFGLPLIVANFLKAMKTKKEAYVFAVATLGGLPGRALTLTKKILEERGIKLSAGFSVRMPGNYTPLYEAMSKEEQEKEFTLEKSRVKEIAAFVHARKKGVIEEKPFLPNFLLYKLLYKGGSRMIPFSDRDFWFTDACVKCGICKSVCPVANIELKDGQPVWLHHCQHCMACLQWCPVSAIQYKKSTIGRKRYHHPAICVEDIMEQNKNG